MIIKKKFQNLFKIFFQLFFKIIYGKVVYRNNNLESKNIIIHRTKDQNIKKNSDNYYEVYKILNGRLYTDQVENLAIIHNNQILDKVSYQLQKGYLNTADKNVVLQKGTPRFKKRIQSRVLVLSQGGSGIENYFHSRRSSLAQYPFGRSTTCCTCNET